MDIPESYLGECKNNSDICAPNLIGDKNKLDELKKETNCDDEKCVVGIKFGDVEVKKHWKPVGPLDNTWLSNYNIDDVLGWWQEEYPDFIHIPYQTIDFMKLGSELSKFNMCENAGKCAGVVINTDTSFGPGEHWFAMFLDMRSLPYTIEYFNSEGTMPKKAIGEFCSYQQELSKKSSKPCEIIIASSIRHQMGNSECGPYSLYYIYSRLNGVGYEVFGRRPISDDYMTRFRKAIFRNRS
jgi:hypothetical protein